MDAAQTLLILVIVLLSVLLLGLGIQVFFILWEFRKTITKANKVLDDTGLITESVSKPISNLSSFASSVKLGALIAKTLKNSKGKRRESDGE